MSHSPDAQVTALLKRVEAGDADANEDLLRAIYAELHRMASSKMRGMPAGQTLQPTALINEVYMRVLGEPSPSWENRKHFFFVAARAMRDILVDNARTKAASKRGGNWKRCDLSSLELAFETPAEDMLELEEALSRLEQEDPEWAQLVHLRFFAGLGERETADILGISYRSVQRRWRFVRAWLMKELTHSEAPEEAD